MTTQTSDQVRASEDVFSFALHAADTLIRYGASSANVTHALLTIARTSGYSTVSANITMGQIAVSYRPAADAPTITRLQDVGTPGFNVHVLAATEQVVEEVITRRAGVREGTARLEEINREQPQQSWPVRLAGWGVMGAGFAWLLGGSLAVCLVAGICTVLIEWLADHYRRASCPDFFVHVSAGILAVAAAALIETFSPTEQPALVITAALVSRLAGATSVGAVHDLLTGWYITAAGRLLDALLRTVGLVVGVVFMVAALRNTGLRVQVEDTAAVSGPIVWTSCAAALITFGFCVTSEVPWRRVAIVTLMGVLAHLVATAAPHTLGAAPATSAALSAVIVGMLVVIVARRFDLPTTGALTVALVPLLPGMALYHCFVSISTHQPDAVTSGFQAASIALALGAGGVFGQYIAGRALWRMKTSQFRRTQRRSGVELDERQFEMRGLSTPDFRRPFTADEVP